MKQNKKTLPLADGCCCGIGCRHCRLCRRVFLGESRKRQGCRKSFCRRKRISRLRKRLAEGSHSGSGRRPERKPCRLRQRRRRRLLRRRKPRLIWGTWRIFPPEPWYLRRRSTGRIWSSILKVMKISDSLFQRIYGDDKSYKNLLYGAARGSAVY